MTIRRQPNGQYAIDSETSAKSYIVDLKEKCCTCADFQYRRSEKALDDPSRCCKHMIAIQQHVEAQTALGRAAEKAADLTDQDLQRALLIHKGDAAQAACLLELAVRRMSQAQPEPRPIPAGVEAFLVGASPEERERALAVYQR